MKDGTALEFLLDVLSTLKKEKGGQVPPSVIKKAGHEFVPSINQRQMEDNLLKSFGFKQNYCGPKKKVFLNYTPCARISPV